MNGPAKPSKGLSALRARVEARIAAEAAQDVDAAANAAQRPEVVSASIADAVLNAALPKPIGRAILRGDAIAVVIAVPGPDWVGPIVDAICEMQEDSIRVGRDGSSRSDHKPAFGNSTVAEGLARGAPVIGVSQAPSQYLPSALIAAADATVTVRAPDGATFRRILRAAGVRPVPQNVADAPCSGLSFAEITAAFRAHATGHDVIAALAKMRARRAAPSDDSVPTLDKLPGLSGEVRHWGETLARDFARWRRGEVAWTKIDGSAVMSGPPGVGKSLFARSLARSLGVPLHATSVGAWFAQSDGALGGVTQHFQRSWDAAMADARAGGAVYFVDEMDAIPDRARLSDRAREWWTAFLALILTTTDGAATDRTGLVLIGATNAGSAAAPTASLDAALVRPGRFSHVLWVDLPTPDDLAAIVSFHLGGALSPADLLPVVRMSPGASAATAATWARDAQNVADAARRKVGVADVLAVVAPPDSRPLADVRRYAIHEAAHAVAALALGGDVHAVTVVATDGTNGSATVSEAPGPATAANIERSVVVALAGRAAEEALLGAVTAGAEGDLAKASSVLAAVHASTGLGDGLLHLAPTPEAANLLLHDPALRRTVEIHLRRLYSAALALVRSRRGAIERVADALVQKRLLTGDEVRRLARVRRSPGIAP